MLFCEALKYSVLVINTFYLNKEVILRELISNGSQNLGKLGCKVIIGPKQFESKYSLEIKKTPYKTNEQLH